MRSFLLLSTLILFGCSGNEASPDENASGSTQAAREATYTIRAGPVPNAGAAALSGTFQLLEVGGPDAIPSNRLGGACLVFPAADLGFTQMAAKQCTKNSDCSFPAENAVGYCDTQESKCWSRPNRPNARTALCNLGFAISPNELNSVPKQPVDVGQFNIRAGAKVRVIACLNRADADLQKDGCGSTDGPKRIEVMGPVATIR